MAKEPTYTKNGRCKICKSDLCSKIDRFLKNRRSMQSIADWANKIDPDIKLTKPNLSNHNRKHRNQCETVDISKSKRGRTKGIKNEKPIPISKKDLPKKSKKPSKKNIEKEGKEEKETFDLNMEKTTKFLDTIISKVNQRIADGDIKPTITEGIKATELKIKIEKTSPFEDTLLSFLEGISTKNGNSS